MSITRIADRRQEQEEHLKRIVRERDESGRPAEEERVTMLREALVRAVRPAEALLPERRASPAPRFARSSLASYSMRPAVAEDGERQVRVLDERVVRVLAGADEDLLAPRAERARHHALTAFTDASARRSRFWLVTYSMAWNAVSAECTLPTSTLPHTAGGSSIREVPREEPIASGWMSVSASTQTGCHRACSMPWFEAAALPPFFFVMQRTRSCSRAS